MYIPIHTYNTILYHAIIYTHSHGGDIQYNPYLTLNPYTHRHT